MGYLMKKHQVLNALEDLELGEIFKVTKEYSSGVIIQSEQDMGSGKCIISLDLQDRKYNCIYFCIGRVDDVSKKDNMLELLNKFNQENILLQFYLDDINSIMARVTYIAEDNFFDAHEYASHIVSALSLLEEEYQDPIMRVLRALYYEVCFLANYTLRQL